MTHFFDILGRISFCGLSALMFAWGAFGLYVTIHDHLDKRGILLGLNWIFWGGMGMVLPWMLK